jgi:hypothetical protein
MKKLLLNPLVYLGFALGQASAGDFSLSGPLTDDASSLIDPANIYTHAISGGTAATVNGVNFEVLSPGVTPVNFSWTSTGGQNEVLNNNGDWNPGLGGVTGSGLISLLQSFTYAGAGANAGQSQTFTLSGLVPGTLYDTRLYIRTWDTEASGRPIDFTFTNGAEIDTYNGLLEDRPGTVLGTLNEQQAFFLQYEFTAQGTDLIINAAVPSAAVADSGSFHLYGLSTQVVPEPATVALLVLGIGLFSMSRMGHRRR